MRAENHDSISARNLARDGATDADLFYSWTYEFFSRPRFRLDHHFLKGRVRREQLIDQRVVRFHRHRLQRDEAMVRKLDEQWLTRIGAVIHRCPWIRFQAAQRDGLDVHEIPRLRRS